MLALSVPRATAEETPREVRERAIQKLAGGDFAGAIPELELLIDMLGKSDRGLVVGSLEYIYYNLGIANFFVGQFSAARTAFDTFDKRYPHGAKRPSVALYRADALRLEGKLDDALREYERINRQFVYEAREHTDIFCGQSRCFLAKDDWHAATVPLEQAYRVAPDFVRRNWAASLLATAYFKDLSIEKIFPITTVLLRPGSFASRSVAFNLAALEAGDTLFGEERYREALWVYRMVYPYNTVLSGSEQHLERLQRLAELTGSSTAGDPRLLFRVQESIGEQEAELEAIRETDNYDIELVMRLARSYMQLLRLREAREIFLRLHDIGGEPLAEESLFYAFQTSLGIPPWTRAFEIGREYMDQYPAGEYYDGLTLTIGQMHARDRAWTNVIAHFTEVLTVRPNHGAGAECMFLLGYASFMEEQFEAAISWLRKAMLRYPESPLREDMLYWTGMSLMFNSQYEEASVEFDALLAGFPTGSFYEDARFRRAICDYGLNNMEAADRRFQDFLRDYPTSRLAGEANMTRGDIGGALGNLTDAVLSYQAGMTDTNLNAEHYNHCSFKCGEILVDEERYADLITHFEGYLRAAREGSNLPQAIYWIGLAHWNQGKQEQAISYYRKAVETYGRAPDEIGIDMILDEWIGRIQRSAPEKSRAAWRDMGTAFTRARTAREPTLSLRLGRALLHNPELDESLRAYLLKQFRDPAALPVASPGVLEFMIDLAGRENRDPLQRQAAAAVLARFPETDYALDARMLLAAAARTDAAATTIPEERTRLREEAKAYYVFVRDIHATSEAAGRSLLGLGAMHTEDKEFDEADACYKDVLGVKSWRPLWPEALYGRGEALFAHREYDKAAAYYERIYLMYGHYADWTAKAYLRRAECLHRSRRQALALEVLQEMLANPELQKQPEAEKAREFLKKMGAV